jgi:hypothetical protein
VSPSPQNIVAGAKRRRTNAPVAGTVGAIAVGPGVLGDQELKADGEVPGNKERTHFQKTTGSRNVPEYCLNNPFCQCHPTENRVSLAVVLSDGAKTLAL